MGASPGRSSRESARMRPRSSAREVDETKPVAMTYVATQLPPSLRGEAGPRNVLELRVLRGVIDLLLSGDVCEARGAFCHQFEAVDMAIQQGWTAARYLNPCAEGVVTSLGDGERGICAGRSSPP